MKRQLLILGRGTLTAMLAIAVACEGKTSADDDAGRALGQDASGQDATLIEGAACLQAAGPEVNCKCTYGGCYRASGYDENCTPGLKAVACHGDPIPANCQLGWPKQTACTGTPETTGTIYCCSAP